MREERDRMRDRVDGRRDRGLRQPEQRAEPHHQQPDEQQRLPASDAPLDPGAPPLVRPDQGWTALDVAPRAPASQREDHRVLQERVARRYAQEKSARKTASIRLSAVALPL